MAVSLDTPLCALLGCRFPVLSVGFSAGAGPELVAAVTDAGGFGVLGAAGMPPELIRAEVERTRGLTGRPFGVNLLLATEPPEYLDEDRDAILSEIAAVADAGGAAVVLFWGDPSPFVAAAQAGGLKVLIQVGSVEEAEAAVMAGVDAVIAQGVEAGGHVRGTTSIWELIRGPSRR